MLLTLEDLYRMRQDYAWKTGRHPRKLHLTYKQLMDLRTDRYYPEHATGRGSEPETILGMKVIVTDDLPYVGE